MRSPSFRWARASTVPSPRSVQASSRDRRSGSLLEAVQEPAGPREGDIQGRGRWVYNITAYNPGQLAISNIEVKVYFVLDVQRLHYQGTIDDPVKTLILTTPVLAGGKDFTWHRTLLIKFAGAHAALKETTAVISFSDPEGMHYHNNWPKCKPQPMVKQHRTVGGLQFP